MADKESAPFSFQIQEFQNASERLQEMLSEVLQMPPIMEYNTNQQKCKFVRCNII